MSKLVLVFFVIAFVMRLRFRRNPRVKARISTWFLLFVASLLLLVFPWDFALGTVGTITVSARLVAASLMLGYLFFDIRRALGAGGKGTAVSRKR
jgi:hypothetical protein